ncbi:MAG TPA: hypothetical protein PKE29_18205 [Phycisphaerales bacterium]|nr:hypothetical protein [Phycisphaerales bacterium]
MTPNTRNRKIVKWGSVAVSLLLVAWIVNGLLESRPVQDLARFAEMRRLVGGRVGTDAINVIPQAIPTGSKDARMWARLSRRGEGTEMVLRCQMSIEDASRIAVTSRAQSAALDAPKVYPDTYCKRGLEAVMPGCESGKNLPSSVQAFFLHHHSLSAGTDEVWSGALVDETTGTVVWWTQRWYVPYN